MGESPPAQAWSEQTDDNYVGFLESGELGLVGFQGCEFSGVIIGRRVVNQMRQLLIG